MAPWDDEKVSRKWSGAWAMIGGAIGLASCSGLVSLDLPTGTNTATIAVTIPRSGEPSFTGTVAGRTLAGAVVGPALNPPQAAFTYKGSLGGHQYVLHAALHFDQSGTSQQPALPSLISFVITGSYGSEAVNGMASFDVGNNLAQANKLKVPFDGHIGTQRVTGSATVTMRGKDVAIVATFSTH
jgi:hypothetical protein